MTNSKIWVESKKDQFLRDVLRDFCLLSKTLAQLVDKHEQDGRVSFGILTELLGANMNKGMLWRLKDTAHILFRHGSKSSPIGQYLDWAIGYIFHECMKLKEDAYQQQSYAPWFRKMCKSEELTAEERLICSELNTVVIQTQESIQREVKRIQFILFHCRRLFILHLPAHRGNQLLARFFYEQESLVRNVFKNEFERLLLAVYADTPEMMFILAAQSLRLGGRPEIALTALRAAKKINPKNKLVLQERKLLDI